MTTPDIEALAKRVADALKPFAALGGGNDAQAFHDIPDDGVVYHNSGKCITAGDVREARRAIAAALNEPVSELHFRKSPEWGDPVNDGQGKSLATILRDAVLEARGFDERWPLTPPLQPHSIAELARDFRWQAADRIEALERDNALHAANYREAVTLRCELQERFDQLAARFTAAELALTTARAGAENDAEAFWKWADALRFDLSWGTDESSPWGQKFSDPRTQRAALAWQAALTTAPRDAGEGLTAEEQETVITLRDLIDVGERRGDPYIKRVPILLAIIARLTKKEPTNG